MNLHCCANNLTGEAPNRYRLCRSFSFCSITFGCFLSDLGRVLSAFKMAAGRRNFPLYKLPPKAITMKSRSENDPRPPDFAHPWLFNDVILVVEDQKFHVHRFALAMWSPVFEKMFTSEFKEKTMCEIPLPGKKASEIKELLLIIYPTVSGKPCKTITNENCYFLAKLAHEYQIDAISQRCGEVLGNLVSAKSGNSFLDDLAFAQTYKLEKLLQTIIGKARHLRLNEFKSHEMYDKIEPNIYKQIVEGIIERHEETARYY